jgi:hypothetical protein
MSLSILQQFSLTSESVNDDENNKNISFRRGSAASLTFEPPREEEMPNPGDDFENPWKPEIDKSKAVYVDSSTQTLDNDTNSHKSLNHGTMTDDVYDDVFIDKFLFKRTLNVKQLKSILFHNHPSISFKVNGITTRPVLNIINDKLVFELKCDSQEEQTKEFCDAMDYIMEHSRSGDSVIIPNSIWLSQQVLVERADYNIVDKKMILHGTQRVIYTSQSDSVRNKLKCRFLISSRN